MDISLFPLVQNVDMPNAIVATKKSNHIHSSYVRFLRDLPASTHCVSIRLTVRKFFCKNPACERKIFTEQPGDEIQLYSRFTNRTRERLQKIFIEVSARKGAYISGLISLPISPSTGLRLVDSLTIPLAEKVSVLGIDDWANRKGLNYGTILVNIETRKVIDLLPGRDGASLKIWLKQHPEIVTVTRDRASSYSCAVTETFPNAIQVADRFHLLKNLSDSVYDVIRHEYSSLANSLIEDSSTTEMISPNDSDKELINVPHQEKGVRNDFFKARFEKVKQMQKEDYKLKAIAKALHMSRNVVRRYARMDTLPNRSIYIKNNYNEYQEIVEKELSEGKCLNTIFLNIKKLGFKGSHTSFYEYYKDHQLRVFQITKKSAPIKDRLMSPRKIARYLRFADFSNIKDNFERKTMISLLEKNTMLTELRHQMLSFKELLLGNDDSPLDDWIKRTLAIGKHQLKTFVNGIRSDIQAVRNAMSTNWSNGQVEGQVNRLKSIKRQMYGRAGFDHLRRKVILSKAG
ncbi:MAG: ISL3 family transposase [Candidatus Saccharimonadaceae bacterium]